MVEENKQKVNLKLLVDKEKKRVVCLECGKDFVDVLFSFMTMPTGTIIRLAGKQPKMGSLTSLYECVEDLDMQFLQTESCKTMLLHPSIALEAQLHDKLVVKMEDAEPARYYICSSLTCHTSESTSSISVLRGTLCHRCGKEMLTEMFIDMSEYLGKADEGVFVEGSKRYMITDDLKVCPVSLSASFSLLEELGINDESALEEQIVNVGSEEVLNLLKFMLVSKTPLTDTFLGVQDAISVEDIESKEMARSLKESDTDGKCKNMSITLLVSKSNNKVVCAEAGEEFAEFLYSFLTFPLGSIAKCLGECTNMGCLDNLYKSIKNFSKHQGMKSDYLKNLLIGPKLPPYFGCKNQLLQIEEQTPWHPTIYKCSICHGINCLGLKDCMHYGKETLQFCSMNPKYDGVEKKLGGTFLKGQAVFVVTNELVVRPLAFKAGISLLSRFNIPMSDVAETVVSVGELEAVSLLKASLVSNTVLNDVFSPKIPTALEKSVAASTSNQS